MAAGGSGRRSHPRPAASAPARHTPSPVSFFFLLEYIVHWDSSLSLSLCVHVYIYYIRGRRAHCYKESEERERSITPRGEEATTTTVPLHVIEGEKEVAPRGSRTLLLFLTGGGVYDHPRVLELLLLTTLASGPSINYHLPLLHL